MQESNARTKYLVLINVDSNVNCSDAIYYGESCIIYKKHFK